MAFNFTYEQLDKHFAAAENNNYSKINLLEYFHNKNNLHNKTLVTRVDVDLKLSTIPKILKIMSKHGIRATFFIRLHAPEYNPFSFENVLILKEILEHGHEIGYHSEIVDASHIWNEDASKILQRDIKILENYLEIDIKGIASHGGNTGLNNLDFWKMNKPTDFDCLYEAYENSESFSLFHDSLYVSDSEWCRWKTYDKGKLDVGNNSTLGDHLNKQAKLVYCLIHSDTYYNKHMYEGNG